MVAFRPIVRSAGFALARCGRKNKGWKHGRSHYRRRHIEVAVQRAMASLPRLLAVRLGNFRNGRIGKLEEILRDNHPALWAHDLARGNILIPTRNLPSATSFLRLYRALRQLVARARSKIAAWSVERGLNDYRNDGREVLRRGNTVPTIMKTLLAGWRGPVGEHGRIPT